MKRKLALFLVLALSISMVAGCGSKKEEETPSEIKDITVEEEAIPEETVIEEPEEEEVEEEENHDGKYQSELTGEWIDESLKDQRPIAAMVDNELTALPHYGVNDADIVYEIMNSTANGRVTRLMCVMKDWQKIEQLGSIRSVRPTNFLVAAEYNAILIHDGGPFYIDPYVAKDYTNNISGGFGRFDNGKASEFTEYVTYEDYKSPKGKTYPGLKTQLENYKYSTTYNSYYPGEHFKFAEKEYDLEDSDAVTAEKIALPFPHNQSKLTYNADSKKYEYSEYGDPHVDAGKGNEVTSFKNVILQCANYEELDEHGYLIYYTMGAGEGYYITNGKAVPIVWSKEKETDITEFKLRSTGEPITLNVGKTYISLVPQDKWSELSMK